ncbi:hypothetical protein [Haloferax mucosum]|uniref:hypothetical protein n=1 Tax=Haloferax mucosum TaxID=403181 RepID=UPI0012675059|nr:hypothetical protein [Haloferax mucosum]
MENKPGVEKSVEAYIDAWEFFGDKRFDVQNLENELLRNRDPADVPEGSKLDGRLYRAAALGLVETYGKKEYRVVVSPESEEDSWREVIQKHINWIQGEIQSQMEAREEESVEEPEEKPREKEEPKILSFEGHEYMSTFVGPSNEVKDQGRFYQTMLDPDKHDGVVLRSYQNVAESTRELAEEICNDDEIAETGCMFRFRIEDEDLVNVEGDREYRVYLREIRFS